MTNQTIDVQKSSEMLIICRNLLKLFEIKLNLVVILLKERFWLFVKKWKTPMDRLR